ncbi:MAG TPA: phosphate ABC transporter ATP-binding protein, partial [Elusimicrobia bacterium]|nr:phosphate ABC transporter ATP-binding protein [Elusimicrobiota bacterium]
MSIRASGQDILRSVSLRVSPGEILGMIGPAGSGKTTFDRALNRLIDLDEGLRLSGRILLNGVSILERGADVAEIRRKIGLVFSVPTPLPISIFDNLAFGPRLNGVTGMEELQRSARNSLQSAYLWDEVKDRLGEPAVNLSGGQQQRL